MTGFFPLLRLELLSRFSALKPRNLAASLKEKKGRTIAFMILYPVLFVYLGAMLIIVESKILDVLMGMGMPDLLLSMAVMMSMVGTLILSFFFIMSSLYFGRDAAFIAALPVRSRTVLCAKLAQVWISETGINALIILPACVMYGLRVGVDAVFYVRMVLVWLVIAMLPITIVSFLSTLLIRLSSLWRHRDMIATVGGIIFLVAYFLLAGTIGGLSGDASANGDMIMQFMAQNSARIDALTRSFPPASWAAKGLLGDWGRLALFMAVSVAGMALVVWLLGYWYRSLSLLQTETPAVSHKKGDVKVSFASGSAFRACCLREIRQILRVPSYAMNILPISFMPLIMVIMITMITSRGLSGDGASLMAELDGVNSVIILAALTALMAYMAGMNTALSTAVTREGKGHDYMTALPVSYKTIVLAKFAVGYGLSILGVLLASIALMVIFPAFVTQAALAFVLCMLYSFVTSCLALSRDVAHPRLDWVTEQEAVKQSFGVLISMLIGWAILAALALLTYLLITWNVGMYAYFGIMAGLLLILSCIMFSILMKTAETKYRQG